MWQDVAGYEGLYQISTHGRVATYDRVYGGGKGLYKSKILKVYKNNKGRLYVDLYDSARNRKRYLVHRLVANAFLNNPENKGDINHINGIPTDNRLVNLEWATRSENELHAYNTGLVPRGEKHSAAKLKDAEVLQIKKLIAYGNVRQTQIAKMYGVNDATICDIKKGRYWKHIKIFTP